MSNRDKTVPVTELELGLEFDGRYPTRDAAELQKDAERIARSLRLIPPGKR